MPVSHASLLSASQSCQFAECQSVMPVCQEPVNHTNLLSASLLTFSVCQFAEYQFTDSATLPTVLFNNDCLWLCVSVWLCTAVCVCTFYVLCVLFTVLCKILSQIGVCVCVCVCVWGGGMYMCVCVCIFVSHQSFWNPFCGFSSPLSFLLLFCLLLVFACDKPTHVYNVDYWQKCPHYCEKTVLDKHFLPPCHQCLE